MRAGEFDFRHGLSRSTGIATSILNAAIVSFHPVLGNLNAKMKIETLKTKNSDGTLAAMGKDRDQIDRRFFVWGARASRPLFSAPRGSEASLKTSTPGAVGETPTAA